MSIRIYKVAGYGLDLKVTPHGDVDDPRIKDWTRLCVWDIEPESVVAWAEEHKTEVLALFQRERPADDPESLDFRFRWAVDNWKIKKVGRLVYYDFDSSPTCVFTHPRQENWVRCDDIIDYLEETDFHHSEPRVQILNRGIYPYDGWRIQIRPPKDTSILTDLARYPVTITPHGIEMTAGEYNRLVGRWNRAQKPVAEGALLEHLLRNFRLTVPDALILYLAWTGAFTDVGAFVNDMRPMIYSYWS